MNSHPRWFTNDNCSVARTLEIIGERWTFLVLREAFMGVRRFEEFQRNTGVARNILASRLRKLADNRILERRRYQDRPARFEYRLTERGLDLYPAIVALLQWGDRHAAHPAGRPVVLEHKGCGKDSTPRLVCSACGEPIGARDMRAKPGPGALPKEAQLARRSTPPPSGVEGDLAGSASSRAHPAGDPLTDARPASDHRTGRPRRRSG
jgi:DNA-binding HxlR family transcriptional regulator